MTPSDIRSRYLAFFKDRGHTVIPSASLVPENDPTTLFTGSGMQPMVPYLLGKDHPAGKRIADSQKAFRSMDIEEVGDNRHTTFFEMLGNWSFGDYFKKEQINWLWEFLTKEIGLDPERIFVTCYIGNPEANIPKDTESGTLWKDMFSRVGIRATEIEIGSEKNGYEVGEQDGRIFYYSDKNWWSRTGAPSQMPAGEPGGPDTEIFYLYPDVVHNKKWGKYCHPNCDCGRFLEIGNSVFMEYVKNADGTFGKLPKRNVDFGGGLERIAMASQNVNDIFSVNHENVVQRIYHLTGKEYGANPEETRSFRIIADHVKAAVFLMGDGVIPGNAERGYVLRRLIRRAVRFSDLLSIPSGTLSNLVGVVVADYEATYPELRENGAHIEEEIEKEERRFRETLAKGMREFDKAVSQGKTLPGKEAFLLFSSYGFPLELTLELAAEQGISVDVAGFKEEMGKHQDMSREGAQHKFKGGLADTAEKTVRLHTAHHLLLRALQVVLGPEVKQRGSNITQERLRIDFLYGQKMTKEQLAEAERIVNEKIEEDLPVIHSEMPYEEAEKLGAEHEFGQKYPERVSVYSVGPQGATSENPHFDRRFSIEFCGGPHVTHTGELAEGGKRFKIQKEEAVAAGIRRIKAVLE